MGFSLWAFGLKERMRKKTNNWKRLNSLIVKTCAMGMLWQLTVSAAFADSVPTASVQTKDLVLPAALVIMGTTGFNSTVKGLNVQVHHDVYSWTKGKQMHIDNYLQYIPMASCLAFDEHFTNDGLRMEERLLLIGTSFALSSIIVTTMKYSTCSVRPYIYEDMLDGDHRRCSRANNPKLFNSFPSGHTATAFLGAELVRLEFGEDCPVMAWGAYMVAAGVGCMRIYNDRHWATDVIAGAGVGILSARFGRWLLPKEQQVLSKWLDRKNKDSLVPTVAISPTIGAGQASLAFHIML